MLLLYTETRCSKPSPHRNKQRGLCGLLACCCNARGIFFQTPEASLHNSVVCCRTATKRMHASEECPLNQQARVPWVIRSAGIDQGVYHSAPRPMAIQIFVRARARAHTLTCARIICAYVDVCCFSVRVSVASVSVSVSISAVVMSVCLCVCVSVCLCVCLFAGPVQRAEGALQARQDCGAPGGATAAPGGVIPWTGSVIPWTGGAIPWSGGILPWTCGLMEDLRTNLVS
mmetsp:Transcript_23711/g.47878  ORF Transcript_23711/g.47878 Transcript_23711/m.47878 type:complete len:230 (+) Transcript_23711:1228-1917(+)